MNIYLLFAYTQSETFIAAFNVFVTRSFNCTACKASSVYRRCYCVKTFSTHSICFVRGQTTFYNCLKQNTPTHLV